MAGRGFIEIAYELCSPLADKEKVAKCTVVLARILEEALTREVKSEDVKRELVAAGLTESEAERVIEYAERPFKIR
jgi:predicted transcriptional regulator